MQIPPLTVIASWPTPNYENPETRGNAMLGLMITFSILVLLAVGGRYYTRVVIKNWFGWDDAMIGLALVFTIAMNVTVLLANRKYGWDRHIWDLEIDKIQDASIVAFTAKLLFVEASTFTRMSLILFYYRLVRDSGASWFRWVLHASMGFVVALGIAFTCVGIWLCVPVQSYWVWPPNVGHYKCLDEGSVTLIIGIFSCCADLLTTILPIPLVMRLQMPLKQRVGACILLGMGFVVTIAGVIRTYFIWKSLIASWDETWFSYPLWICAAIEIDLAVICACAPALKSLLHRPLSAVTSHISSKLSSLRSSAHPRSRRPGAGNHNNTNTNNNNKNINNKTNNNDLSSSSHRSLRLLPFRKKHSGGDSIWDGDEEYGMLKGREDVEGRRKGEKKIKMKARTMKTKTKTKNGGGGGGKGEQMESEGSGTLVGSEGEGDGGGESESVVVVVEEDEEDEEEGEKKKGKGNGKMRLEILKRQSVDQEVRYLTPEEARDEEWGRREVWREGGVLS